MIVYVESSAAAKLLFREEGSAALKSTLDGLSGDGMPVISSTLLETELRRAATRTAVDQQNVSEVLERILLLDVERADFRAAGLLPGPVRSLDALHVAVALRIGADVMITYDEQQAEAARSAGLSTLAPA